jgi:putative transposase
MPSVCRAFKRRIYPTAAQESELQRWFAAARWVWNETLAIRSEGYRHCGLRLTGVDLSRWLTQWKKTVGHEWLAHVPRTCYTQLLRDQDRAFSNFFAKRAKYPRPKRRGTARSVALSGC